MSAVKFLVRPRSSEKGLVKQKVKPDFGLFLSLPLVALGAA